MSSVEKRITVLSKHNVEFISTQEVVLHMYATIDDHLANQYIDPYKITPSAECFYSDEEWKKINE